MAFEKYDGTRSSGRQGTAAVSTQGVIRLNGNYAKTMRLPLEGYVCLFFDAERKLLAIRASRHDEVGARKLATAKNTITVAAEPALQQWNIDFSVNRRVPVIIVDDEPVLNVAALITNQAD